MNVEELFRRYLEQRRENAERRALHTGGRVALFYALEPPEFQLWLGVERVMQEPDVALVRQDAARVRQQLAADGIEFGPKLAHQVARGRRSRYVNMSGRCVAVSTNNRAANNLRPNGTRSIPGFSSYVDGTLAAPYVQELTAGYGQSTVLDGLTTREAGRLLGIPSGTVKTRMMRANSSGGPPTKFQCCA